MPTSDSPVAPVRSLLLVVLALAAALASAAPVSAAETATEAERVLAVARNQLGDPWSFAATGPNEFDCSGFVTFVFRETELLDRIGGKRRTVRGFYRWFNSRGLASRRNPRPGDLVVWGRNKHIGIYIGDGKAISALVNPYGVKIHPVKGYLDVRFKAYLHVKLER
jgi:cell wall-associated NlpC family hydrolase